MKTTVFELTGMMAVDLGGYDQGISAFAFRIPSLPAYTVLNHSLDCDNEMNFETGRQRPLYEVSGDKVVLRSDDYSMVYSQMQRGTLSIFYAGIRDYSLLFPHIENEELRTRLGQFAEEAEKAFDTSAWMSFVLMAGAVIEGLLMAHYYGHDGPNRNRDGKVDFFRLINRACDERLLSPKAQEHVHMVREARNSVHADRFKKPFVDRKLAMDTYLVYDRLLKRRWDLAEQG